MELLQLIQAASQRCVSRSMDTPRLKPAVAAAAAEVEKRFELCVGTTICCVRNRCASSCSTVARLAASTCRQARKKECNVAEIVSVEGRACCQLQYGWM